MMKPIKGLLIILIALAVVFTFSQSALAALGSQGGAGDEEGSIVVTKDAKGTKYVGPLTTYVVDNPEYVPGEDTSGETPYLIYFFLRLKKGWDLYAFSGIAGLTNSKDIPQMQFAIDAFVANTVIPILYHEDAPKYPRFWLKAVENIAEDEPTPEGFPPCCNDSRWFLYANFDYGCDHCRSRLMVKA